MYIAVRPCLALFSITLDYVGTGTDQLGTDTDLMGCGKSKLGTCVDYKVTHTDWICTCL